MNIIEELFAVIEDRKANPVEGSYTNYLFDKGVDKISKKIGEEAVETAIAAAHNDKAETVNEIADLIYHLLVLMGKMDISLEDVEAELKSRR
ncbi:MAG: phosphoribosyl-ATP diphosphatase [Clostridia bacterium]|nr:phosphoribosyl-ATP diphosphatase [Clostridia bacterium]